MYYSQGKKWENINGLDSGFSREEEERIYL